MRVLGLQGSPRLKGNTATLLDAFLNEAGRLGAITERLDVVRQTISPCVECGTCEKEGFCPFDDDMQEVYGLLWHADLVVLATPIFFYGPTAQLKALIDRSQALWARRYVHRLSDPGRQWRQGYLLSVGATKGKNLFDGTILTAKYFFDAVGAHFSDSLTFRRIEGIGDVDAHPTALSDAKAAARRLTEPFMKRKKILFISRNNACRSQMAAAFARLHGGDRLEVESAGTNPSEQVHPDMVKVMAEKGIDMGYLKPRSVAQALEAWKPEAIISFDGEAGGSGGLSAPVEVWAFGTPDGLSLDAMSRLRDKIVDKVHTFLP